MTRHTALALSGLLTADAFAAPPPIFMMASPADRIAVLNSKYEELESNSQAILDSLEDDADLSAEQLEDIKANTAKMTEIKAQVEALTPLVPKSAGRKTTAELENRGADGRPERKVPAQARDNARHNFANLGEFAMGVRMLGSGNHENETVKKLMNAATTYGNEGSGVDGGFLVPPEFSRQLWQKVEAEENLMDRCSQLTPSGNSMSIPKDETTPWGTAGIRVYWEGEASQMTQSKAAFEMATFRLYKLTALVPASDELIEDATGYESFIMAKVPGIMSATINDKIVSGNGAGQPLGILSSPSLVSVAKQTSQPADTVWHKNIAKMWSRMYAPWRRNSIWLINQDIEPSLMGMAFQAAGSSSDLPGTSAVPAYLPPNGLSQSPYGTLMGRPVVPVQAAKTVGDQGDIILVDLKQYWVLRKASGLKTDTSIHLYFDQNVTAFRFVFRMNGQPAWSSAISPQNGSNTLSWAVVLDAR